MLADLVDGEGLAGLVGVDAAQHGQRLRVDEAGAEAHEEGGGDGHGLAAGRDEDGVVVGHVLGRVRRDVDEDEHEGGQVERQTEEDEGPMTDLAHSVAKDS